MRHAALLCSIAALVSTLAGCPKKNGNASDAAVSDAATAPSASTAATKVKPPPPHDAATSCKVELTGKHASFMSKDGLEYKMTNAGTRELRFCQITTYAYDKSGKQIGRDGMSENHTLKPGESYVSSSGLTINDASGKSLVKTPGVTFEVAVGNVIFSDDSEWEDTNVAPMERPKGGKK